MNSTSGALSTPQYPMRVVVRRTRLTASLLRAWERRYGAVVPGRSEGGQRLYSEADIRRLVLLRDLTVAGHNISLVAELDGDELRVLLRRARGEVGDEGVGTRGYAVPGTSERGAAAGDFLERTLAAVHGMEVVELERMLHRAALTLAPEELMDSLLVPLLARIGLLWEGGEVGAAEEHLASTVVRRFLYWLLGTLAAGGDAPLMLVGTPAGHRHEFGSLLAGAIAAGEGWRVVALGPDLPSDEIATAARRQQAPLVVLSALHPADDPALPENIALLRALLPEGTEVILGGPAADRHRGELEGEGVTVIGTLTAFRSYLRERIASFS